MAHDKYIKKQKTDQQFLGHVVEESGEVLAAIGKIMRWGWTSYNPEVPAAERETNIDWLVRELDDLEAAIKRLRDKIGLPGARS